MNHQSIPGVRVWHDQPVATARELLADQDRIAWPAPLVRWLRERSFGLALDWVFRITPELLLRTGSPHAVELLADLGELQRWRAAPAPSGVFLQKVEDLWYRPDRDVACTAMSHLCMGLAQVVCPDLEVGDNWLWHVPSLLCDNDFQGQPRTELVEWCLSDFEAFVAGLPEPSAAVPDTG
jgi:hypothetical protein